MLSYGGFTRHGEEAGAEPIADGVVIVVEFHLVKGVLMLVYFFFQGYELALVVLVFGVQL